MSSILYFCQLINDAPLATALRESDWTFSVVESIHVLAITLVAGTVAVVDLRILGWLLPGEPLLPLASGILRVTWIGFAIMLATGTLLFCAEAAKLAGNAAFRFKLIMLALLGLNQLWFHRTQYRSVVSWGEHANSPPAARWAAAVSLLLWAGVIVTGRAIAYL